MCKKQSIESNFAHVSLTFEHDLHFIEESLKDEFSFLFYIGLLRENNHLASLYSQSHYNKIYNNTISDSQYGINVVFGSSGNTFYSNVVRNTSHGIDSQGTTSNKSKNTFNNNLFINSHYVISSHNNKPSLGIS